MAISREMEQGTRTTRVVGSTKSFLIEALVVLALLMSCLAVFAKLFTSAYLEGQAANQLSGAVLVAQNCAEEFSANPLAVSPTSEQGDYVVSCTTTEQSHAQGTLFQATIVVSLKGEEVYSLTTSRYVKAAEEPALKASATNASQGGEAS